MKKLFWIFMVSFLAIGQAPNLLAEDAPVGMPPMDEKMVEAMKLMAPGENHAKLAQFIGKFKATTTMWMDAASAPQISEGISESKWILGGRFVQQTFTGQFMGKPFEGMGIIGYDNVAKEYNSIWLDSVSTGIMKATAKYDDATKVFSEEGSFSCPLTGRKDNAYKSVTTVVDADHYTYEMWHDDVKTGKNYKAMAISYERIA